MLRPNNDNATRVWACGLLHSIAQRSRLAVRTDAQRRPVPDPRTKKPQPLTLQEMVDELNAHDPYRRMTLANLSKLIDQLAAEGKVRSVGRFKSGRRLYFYWRPRRTKSEQIVVKFDNNGSRSDSKARRLPQMLVSQLISQITGTVVRTLMIGLRILLPAEMAPDLRRVRQDLEPVFRQIQQILEGYLNSAKAPASELDGAAAEPECERPNPPPPPPLAEEPSGRRKRERIVVKFDNNGSASDSNTSHLSETQCLQSEPSQVKAEVPAQRAAAADQTSRDRPAQPHPLAPLRRLFPLDHISDHSLDRLAARLERDTVGLPHSLDSFIGFVAARQSNGRKLRAGALFVTGGLVDDYVAWLGHQKAEHRTSSGVAPPRERVDILELVLQLQVWREFLRELPDHPEAEVIRAQLRRAARDHPAIVERIFDTGELELLLGAEEDDP
jgi:hypothetical protein